MTPAAASVNEAWLWVFCYSGLFLYRPEPVSPTPRNGAHARSTTTESSSLSAIEICLGVAYSSHSTVGMPRLFEPGLFFKMLLPALRRRSHQPIPREGPCSIARSEEEE